MIVSFAITSLAQKQFQKTYSELHYKKGSEPLESVYVQSTIIYNYQDKLRVKIDIDNDVYLYEILEQPSKGGSDKFGAYQNVKLLNGNKHFILTIFDDEKYGVIISSLGTLFWFK